MKLSEMPAFAAGVEGVGFQEGMTYRQWLAGLAMQGLLANEIHRGDASEFAHEAVEYANALLAELEK